MGEAQAACTQLGPSTNAAFIPSRREWGDMVLYLSSIHAKELGSSLIWLGLQSWNVTGNTSQTVGNLTWAAGLRGGYLEWEQPQLLRRGPSGADECAALHLGPTPAMVVVQIAHRHAEPR